MHRMIPFFAASALSLGSLPALAGGGGHAGDIHLQLDGFNRIVTGSETDDFLPDRVFAGEFGDTGIFNFTSNPGFDAEDGTFPPSSLVGFNILDALHVWNGAGFDVAPNTLTINFGSLQRSTSTGFVAGFGLLTSAQGGWHRHFGFTLNGVTENDSGIYLLQLDLWHESSAIHNSLPFWIVFNFNESEVEHELAIDWVRSNLVPAPGALALLGVGAVAMGRRRRRD